MTTFVEFSSKSPQEAPSPGAAESWTAATAKYGTSVGTATSPFGEQIVMAVSHLQQFDSSSYVLDLGCGLGSIELAIKDHFPDVSILAADISRGMIAEVAKLRLAGVTTELADVMDLSSITKRQLRPFTHVLANFVVQFAPSPFKAITEMLTVLGPGSVLGLSTWGSVGSPRILFEAMQQVLPSFEDPGLYPTKHFPQSVEHLEKLFREFGLQDVKVAEGTARYQFGSMDEYLDILFEGKNPAIEQLQQAFAAQAGPEAAERVKSKIPGLIEAHGWTLSYIPGQTFTVVGRKPMVWTNTFNESRWLSENPTKWSAADPPYRACDELK